MTDLRKVTAKYCHYGILLPPDGGPCPKCGADSKGVCGKLYEAGQRDARAEFAAQREELIAALRELVSQIDKSGAVDDHGHAIVRLKALADAHAALAKASAP